MAEVRAIKRLVKGLEIIKAQAHAFTRDTCISDINASLAVLADEWKEYQLLEKVVKGKFDDAHAATVEKLEADHFEIKQKLFKWQKLYEMNNDQGQHGNNGMDELLLNQTNFIHEISSMNRKGNEVRLPRVNIPVFSGKYSEFPSFRDLFEVSIHGNANISKVHKLQYLRGLLKGEAYTLINHIAVTEANYDEVWEKIKSRYNKQKHVVHSLLKQFMDQPTVLQGCSKSIRRLTEVSDEVLRGLRVLGEEAESRDPWLIFMLLNKLDTDSKEAWAHETASIDFPSMDLFFKFLNKRSDALESLDSFQKSKSNTSRRATSLVSQFGEAVCPLCSENHYVGKCMKFIDLSSAERKQVAADKKLCFNCLSSTHQSTVCRSRYSCRKCRRRHHILLHPESVTNEAITAQTIVIDNRVVTKEADQNNPVELSSCSTELKTTSIAADQSRAILPTACVLIADKYGRKRKCRALLDSGSQCSFISEDCVQRLQLPRERANIKITGITSGSLTSRGKVRLTLNSLYDSPLLVEISALVISRLPSKLQKHVFCEEDRKSLENIELADPDFNEPSSVDILIGADKFFDILESGKKRCKSIILYKTIFGWIVSGQPESIQDSNAIGYMALNVQLDMDVDRTLRRFWEIDEMPHISTHTPEDTECEEFYVATHKRLDDGRYMVRLPFKKTSEKLGNSLIQATQRFLSLERKLSKDKPLKKQYIDQMNDYINTGHMSDIPQTQDEIPTLHTCYLPHHCVTKETSSTTKVRVVFDGSSKSSNGISLNDRLMVGPTIQPTLWATLMRFRCHRIAITADIEKMYRQVLVAPEDTNYQRILWRESSSEKIRHYKLNRVTFGLSCSAYLAIRTLQQLAHDTKDESATHHILNDFYVDDFLSGARTIEEARQLKDNMMKVLQRGGFALRKWRSNIQSLCEEEIGKPNVELCNSDNASVVMVLGLSWHPAEDIFTFRVSPETNIEVTKRVVISQTSRIFDPLGFLAPSIILLKTLFQRLWFLKLDWDDKLPDHYIEFYKNIRSAFIFFQEVKITRFASHDENMQIHGFADASEVAYCAVVYSRTINENGEISTNLLMSKTKVAPVRKVSLPRLELCAAHLLAKLMYTVKQTIAPNAMCYAWTDSSIVLAWLSTYPARWKTFIANRTSEILERFPRQHWRHVRSKDNPADHGSRGIHPQNLVKLQQWWEGPGWLKSPENLWPQTHSNSTIDDAAAENELRKDKLRTNVLQATVEDDCLNNIFQRKSKLIKILRVVAYVKRYVNNSRIRNPAQRYVGELKAKEIACARTACIIWVQSNCFDADIVNLRRNKTVNNKSHILSLAPFLDAMGVLRVGGRLSNANSDYESKHQIILPSNHVFTERLIWETHTSNYHAGPTLTSNLIRQGYWIVKGRAKIRTIINRCVTCAKYARKTSSQLMGNLPAERITPTRPFTNCGIDFAGPIQFATKKGRGGTQPVKGYICIFVCFSVKAIHIEPVSDLTSAAFLAALRRFTARRGVPENIYTDNGANFVGAKRLLSDARKLIENINHNYAISEYLSEKGINWHFIPPASPHFGGLWESAVKSVKTHLLKSTRNVNLTFEEMATLLCQIENILNSRPLCTTSTDDDYEVLTPAHFLIGTSTGSLPERTLSAAETALTRWERIQSRTQAFWEKYRVDYINNLQQRHKWHKPAINLAIGDVVMVKEDNIPVCRWPLARIIKVHPGDDTRVRVVTIRTSNSILQRPVAKICKLPVG